MLISTVPFAGEGQKKAVVKSIHLSNPGSASWELCKCGHIIYLAQKTLSA